ncbi:MAG: hypothetical protein A2849_03935 [Candidatus Taylorbacteria bacterium RIFCSPHIGHO2_01_FULL_51_15]|uniref:VTT domain-containing protein n=1 Tax=Candidatus Taylorbacteria bacterium RIFCSPHIGHO2_01_FULL_51_15 TaxID=1802304 RepID=A0A1G2MCB5_9BACT|nr:MAG: hypothetical protein A2849_03935 [Candidatus Taylorbacteria bacterium RIFCSPHIGHO2_01_FULL_51_15]
MNFGTTTLALLNAYEFPALFLGGFFFGETVIIPAAFLAGQGILSLTQVFSITYLGTVCADMLWFFIGPSLFRFAHRFEKIRTRSEKVLMSLDTLYAKRPFRVLLISKFVYGTRILTILYLSLEKLSVVRFLLVNLLSTFVWLVGVVAVGWLAGKSIVNVIPVLSDAKYVLFIIVLLVLIVRFGPTWFAKRLQKE